MHTDLEDCWGLCGAKGGACNVEGCNGYCCSSSLVELNGDCPASAIQFLLDHEAIHSSGHKCVEPMFTYQISIKTSDAPWSGTNDYVYINLNDLELGRIDAMSNFYPTLEQN